MPSRRTSTGFTIIESILVIVVVGILGLSSWLVYQHVKTSATTTKAAPNPSTNQPVATTPGATAAYLDIKEWGVRLPLTDTIKDAYYVAGEDKKDGQLTTMWLGLKSLTGATCDPSNNNQGQRGAIGAIQRFPVTEVDGVTGELLTKEYPNGTTVGSYYIFYQSWAKENPCASQAALQSADSAFAGEAKTTAATAVN